MMISRPPAEAGKTFRGGYFGVERTAWFTCRALQRLRLPAYGTCVALLRQLASRIEFQNSHCRAQTFMAADNSQIGR